MCDALIFKNCPRFGMTQPMLLLLVLIAAACQHSQRRVEISPSSGADSKPEVKNFSMVTDARQQSTGARPTSAIPSAKPPTLADLPASNTEENVIRFEEFAKHFSKGRISRRQGDAVATLEIFHEDTWFPLLDAPDLSQEPSCLLLSPTEAPGWRFDGEAPMAVVFEKSRAILYAGAWDSNCAKSLVLLQNRVPGGDSFQAFSKISFGYDDPDVLAKKLRSELVGDYLPSPGIEKIHITLDDV
ncbi:MAG: hypothetical protein JXX14_22235 [Deltaproteobacteria bacterium]|nr:hypothetical protein [Deltaproteobacteria bacterium]